MLIYSVVMNGIKSLLWHFGIGLGSGLILAVLNFKSQFSLCRLLETAVLTQTPKSLLAFQLTYTKLIPEVNANLVFQSENSECWWAGWSLKQNCLH